MSWPAVHQQAHKSSSRCHAACMGESPSSATSLSQNSPLFSGILAWIREGSRWSFCFSLTLKPGCALSRDRWDTGNAVFSYLQVRSSVCIVGSGQKLHRASEILVWEACFLNEVLFQLLHSMVLSKSLVSSPHFFLLFTMSGREMLFAVQFSYNSSPNSFLLLLINMTLYFLLFVNSYSS